MKCCCTIITANYFHFAITLYKSLEKFDAEIILKVFISDVSRMDWVPPSIEPNIHFYFVEDLCAKGIGKKIYKKYAKSYKDGFRWSMKPVLMKYLIEKEQYEKVIWTDCDLFFVSNYQFLFDKLDHDNILLTPHWRSSDPLEDERNFSILFTGGLFNAGFLGANGKGITALNWWANSCLYNCEQNKLSGFWDDQKYLDAFPILFDKVKILEHRGCNIAEWNRVDCKRTKSKNGQVLINNKWEVVFVHFTKWTQILVANGTDELLQPYLEEWRSLIKKYDETFEIPEIKNTSLLKKMIGKLIHKLRVAMRRRKLIIIP